MKRIISPVLIGAIALVAIRCSDPGAVGPENPDGSPQLKGMVISNPHQTSVSDAVLGRTSVSTVNDEEIAYVSLAPKTLPGAETIQIDNRTQNLPGPLVTVIDGGFDPVPIHARVSDTLEITASMADGHKVSMSVKVPAKRPPSVVRTNPGKGRTEVALNVIVAVVFTEPVDRATVNASSIQLRRDGKPVGGEVI
jgi:hypothetical protein